MIRSYFARGVSEQGDMKKRQFPKDGVRSVTQNQNKDENLYVTCLDYCIFSCSHVCMITCL